MDGKHYTGYEATQMQRRLERAIRKQKRRILVAGDDDTRAVAQTRLQRLRQEYSRFSKAAGLRTEDERLHVAGFGRKEAVAAKRTVENAERYSARFRDIVTIIPPLKGDAITHRNLYNNLARTEVGRETIEYITAGKCIVEISYADDPPFGERGYNTGVSIVIHAKNTRTIKETAKTLVHEVTHAKYKVGGDQHAEVVCYMREHLHEFGVLTQKDIRGIIKHVKSQYPNYRWRKGVGKR